MRRVATPAIGAAAVVLVVAGLTAGLAVAPAEGATTANASVRPAGENVSVGATTTFTVVLDPADGGVGQYGLNVSVANASVAEIVDVEYELGPATDAFRTFNATFPDVTQATTTADRVWLQQFGVGSADTGAVTLATVTVQGQSAGTTAIEIVDGVDAADEAGDAYAISGRNNATLKVAGGSRDKGAAFPSVGDDSVPLVRSWNRTVRSDPLLLPQELAVTPSGGYIYSDTSGTSLTDVSGEGRVGVVSPTGRLVSQNSFGATTAASGLTDLGGGRYAVAGADAFTVELPGGSTQQRSTALVRTYRADGSVRWTARPHKAQITFESSGPVLQSDAAAVAPANGGGVIVTGFINKQKQSLDPSDPSKIGGALLMKLDGSGEEQWNRSFNQDKPDEAFWTGNDVIGTTRG